MQSVDPAGKSTTFRRSALWTSFALWTAAGIVILALSVLFGAGILGSVRPQFLNTDYRAAVGAQPPHKTVSLSGIQIAYADSGGSGPVIICLHAIGHGARDFEDLSRRLSPEYRVIALDFPGQGNSGPDFKPASATRYAELLSQFNDQLNLKSVVLVGNSIGGATSIRYAATHPQRVKALVLCDTGGLGNPGFTSRLFIGAFVQFFAAGRRGAFWYPWAFKNYYEHVLINEPAFAERDRIVRSAYEIASPLEQAWKSFAKPEENLLGMLPEIQCPVLLAWAKHDIVIPLKYSQAYFGLFKNRQLEVFNSGHAAFLEDPDHFERSIRAFLKKNPSGGLKLDAP
jgi:pimeloyl-ACP methyl ester carboxylesterase